MKAKGILGFLRRREEPETLGMKAVVRFTQSSFMEGKTETFRNVTEIHWNYQSMFSGALARVAFESDVHGTGWTCESQDIAEMEVRPETKRAAAF